MFPLEMFPDMKIRSTQPSVQSRYVFGPWFSFFLPFSSSGVWKAPLFPIMFVLNSGNLILCPNFPEDHRVWLIQYFSFIVLLTINTNPTELKWLDLWKFSVSDVFESLLKKCSHLKHEIFNYICLRKDERVRFVRGNIFPNGPILASPC